MQRPSLHAVALLALISLARAPITWAQAPAPRPGPDAVWDPPAGAIERVHDELERHNGAEEAAIVNAMQAFKAKPAAIAFAHRLGDDGGYLGSLKPSGPLLIGQLYFPLRANENAEPYVIDAANRLVRPAQECNVTRAELDRHPLYAKLANKAELSLWPPQSDPVESKLPEGGQELVYAFRLRPCHACADAALVKLGYAFGADGKYKGRRVVDVVPPPKE